ncbi:MAG: hypothetical protein J6B54_02320 [Clostridia bacterium]|nr:hypothetical protein [Clostridia bacterium]
MNAAWIMGIALVAVIGSQFLRSRVSELSQFLPIAAIVILFFALLPSLESIVTAIRDLGQRASIEEGSVGLILRGIGIGLVTRLSSGVCVDCGQKALGETVDYCGQIAIVSLAVPLILDLAQRILETEF